MTDRIWRYYTQRKTFFLSSSLWIFQWTPFLPCIHTAKLVNGIKTWLSRLFHSKILKFERSTLRGSNLGSE